MARRIGFGRRIGCAWGCLSFFATPRMIHRADDGLPTFAHVHMMHDNPLLAAAPKPSESVNLRRISAQKLQAKELLDGVQINSKSGAGNAPVRDNDWEQVKRGGDKAIEKWIDNQLDG